MIPSRIVNPFRKRPTKEIAPGLYLAQESNTGWYRFFPHSPAQYFINLRLVSEEEYVDYVAGRLIDLGYGFPFREKDPNYRVMHKMLEMGFNPHTGRLGID